MNIESVTAVIDRKREQHPELARALTWPGFVRICHREHIRLSFQQLPRDAQLVPFLGGWSILLNKNLPFRRHTYRGVHELGHLWLHHDELHERTERVYNMDVAWSNDPREDDAELFATLVLSGPNRVGPYVVPPDTAAPLAQRDPRAETHLQFTKRMLLRKKGRTR